MSHDGHVDRPNAPLGAFTSEIADLQATVAELEAEVESLRQRLQRIEGFATTARKMMENIGGVGSGHVCDLLGAVLVVAGVASQETK